MEKKKVGEVLLEAGLITPEQLENALNLQKGKNKRIGRILVELGYINEMQVAEALSRQTSTPLVDWENVAVTKDLLSLVPKEIAEKKTVLPIELRDKTLILAMA